MRIKSTSNKEEEMKVINCVVVGDGYVMTEKYSFCVSHTSIYYVSILLLDALERLVY